MEARWSWRSVFRSRFVPVLLLALAGALSGVGVSATSRTQQAPPGTVGRPTVPGENEPHDPFAEQTASKMTHMREDERRKRLIADTARLVALTSELRSEVEGTPRDELSLDVIRKATEIEKLAHDVRERMKN